MLKLRYFFKKRNMYFKCGIISEKDLLNMHCEFPQCHGHVLLHNEGSTCMSCNRVQQGGNWETDMMTPEVLDPEPSLRREFAHVSDRHIIPTDCALAADKLYTFVRNKHINYPKNELLALCLLQAVFQLCNQSLSVKQLGGMLHCSLHEVFFRRKHNKLCMMFPALFSVIPFNTSSYGLSILGLTPKTQQSLRNKCRELMIKSKFEFSQGAALYSIMSENRMSSDKDLLNFIASYPKKYEMIKCKMFLNSDKFNLVI